MAGKKWLERLQVEKVPVLVCLSHADKLYAEYMTDDGQHPDKGPMANEIEVQLSVSLIIEPCIFIYMSLLFISCFIYNYLCSSTSGAPVL